MCRLDIPDTTKISFCITKDMFYLTPVYIFLRIMKPVGDERRSKATIFPFVADES